MVPGWTDNQADGTNGWMHKETDRWTDGWIDRQTHRWPSEGQYALAADGIGDPLFVVFVHGLSLQGLSAAGVKLRHTGIVTQRILHIPTLQNRYRGV